MTDEERQRFARRLRERDAEIERLRAALQNALVLVQDFASGPGMSYAGHAEFDRLRAALEPKPDLRALLPELAVIRQVMKEPKS